MKKKIVLAIISLSLIFAFSSEATLALFKDNDNVSNRIEAGEIKIHTMETIVENGKENVGATLSADSVRSWVRVFVGIPNGPEGEKIFKCTPSTPNSNWIDGGDNYFYYKEVLNPNDTVILYDKISYTEILSEDTMPSNLNIIVYAEAVQENTGKTVKEAFSKLGENIN